MKFFISALLLLFATFASSQIAKKNETWNKIFEDSLSVHEVNPSSFFEMQGATFFVIKVSLKAQVTINGKKVTKIIMLGAVNCSKGVATIVSDVMYNGDELVAEEVVAQSTPVGPPEKGTPLHIMMSRVCVGAKGSV